LARTHFWFLSQYAIIAGTRLRTRKAALFMTGETGAGSCLKRNGSYRVKLLTALHVNRRKAQRINAE